VSLYAPPAPPAQENSSTRKNEVPPEKQPFSADGGRRERRHPRTDTRYVACLSKPPDFDKSAFIIESNGANFTPIELRFLQNVAAAIRVNGKYPDLFEPVVSHFPIELMLKLAVQRDIATMPSGGRA
jgi:hypothetical protein